MLFFIAGNAVDMQEDQNWISPLLYLLDVCSF